MFIEILKAALYGILEGITEWLPVSSTGHMILFEEILPMKVSENFWNVFLVVIQLGAILAVVLLYWNKIFPFNFKNKNRPFIRYDIMNLWGKILVACIPAAIVGIAFDDILEKYLYTSVVVATMLVLVGIAFLIIENRNRHKRARVTSLQELSYVDALKIGVFQLIADYLSGNFTQWGNYFRRLDDWGQSNNCGRIYLLFSNSGHVWRKLIKIAEIWFILYWC